eukprot:scaffold113955_cov28-Attheya_sp.AAC.6
MDLTVFATSNPGSDGWQEALQHFTDPNKEIPPMPVRRAIFDKTNHRLRTQLYDVYAKLMHLTADSLEPSDHPDNWQSTSTPFIIISIIFPILILAPLVSGAGKIQKSNCFNPKIPGLQSRYTLAGGRDC